MEKRTRLAKSHEIYFIMASSGIKSKKGKLLLISYNPTLYFEGTVRNRTFGRSVSISFFILKFIFNEIIQSKWQILKLSGKISAFHKTKNMQMSKNIFFNSFQFRT